MCQKDSFWPLSFWWTQSYLQIFLARVFPTLLKYRESILHVTWPALGSNDLNLDQSGTSIQILLEPNAGHMTLFNKITTLIKIKKEMCQIVQTFGSIRNKVLSSLMLFCTQLIIWLCTLVGSAADVISEITKSTSTRDAPSPYFINFGSGTHWSDIHLPFMPWKPKFTKRVHHSYPRS